MARISQLEFRGNMVAKMVVELLRVKINIYAQNAMFYKNDFKLQHFSNHGERGVLKDFMKLKVVTKMTVLKIITIQT